MPEPKPVIEKCPECDADLSGMNPRAHALDHWPETLPTDPKNKEARRRQAILYKMAEKRGM